MSRYRNLFTQLHCYALIGIISNIAGYLLYLLITHLGVTPKITMTVLYGVGATIGFWGNRKLTFNHQGSLLGSGFRYIIAHSVGYSINFLMLTFMVDSMGYSHQWVQALAILVVALFIFISFKLYVFSQ
jgi:putative flippase GtrA